MSAYKKYLAELFFYMKEFFDFETEFKSNLSQNIISGNIACLVDTDEIDNWKMSIAYDECLEFLENYDQINFEKKQFELFQGKFNKNRMNFKAYETINEICEALKHNKRISVISQQFYCYLNNITYTPTMFNYYIKNNQLIIYFGTGKCLFIPDYSPEKKLDSENIFVIDLPQKKTSFIEGIFKNQNMSDTFNSKKSMPMNINNLMNFTINKNSLKKDKTYNFYQENDDFLDKNKFNKSNNVNYSVNNNNFNSNINLNYSNNINTNSINNNLNEIGNSNNQMLMNYDDNLIDTKKPYIKEGNLTEEEYQYMNNKNNNFTEVENNDDIGRSQDQDNNKKENDIIEKKNDEYNKGYKNTYKDKEIEYHELLKEKNNNLDNLENSNNINENNTNNLNNINLNQYEDKDNNINPNVNNIEEKKEMRIYEENKYTTPNGNIYEKKEIIIENNNSNPVNNINNINMIEDKKDENENTDNIKNTNNNNFHDSDKEEIITEKPILDNNEEEKKEEEKKEEEKKDEEKEEANPDENKSQINNNINNTDYNVESKDNYESIKFKIIGLENIDGKSSYINSVIQCLSNTIPLTNYFLNDKNKEKIINNNISIKNPDAPQLSPSYLNIIQNLWNNNNHLNYFSPSDFIKNIRNSNSEFEKEEENDVGRLIIFILECLDAELNNNYNKNIENKNEILLSNNKNEIKNLFYDELSNNNSIIYDTFFGGVCEISRECKKCQEQDDTKKTMPDKTYKTYEYQKLNYLIFQIKDIFAFTQSNDKKDNIDIYDCLNYFKNPVLIEGDNSHKCPNCSQISPYILTSTLNTVQNNLLVLLNRDFQKEKDIKFKIDQIVDVTGYVNECDGEKKIIYNLYGIICLSNNDVHYVAFCRNPIDKMWYKYNDTIIEPVNDLENDVIGFGIPVALFYQMEIV